MSTGIPSKKFDNLWLGATVGIIAPFITLIILVNTVYPKGYLEEMYSNMLVYIIAPKIISLSAIPNLAFFMLSIYTNRYKTSKGILGATIILAVVVFILKLSA